MASTFFLLAAFAFSSYLYYRIKLVLQSRRLSRLASERGCAQPPIRNFILPFGFERMVKWLLAPEDIAVLQARAFKKFNAWTIKLHFPLQSVPTIITAEPANVQAVLASSFNDWGVGRRRWTQMSPLLGQGIFTSDGEPWAHARRMLRPSLARDQISEVSLVEHHLQHLLRVFEPATRDGWSNYVDAKSTMNQFTTNFSTDFLFGQSATDDALATDLASKDSQILEWDEFNTAFNTASSYMEVRMRLGPLVWLHNFHPFFRGACNQLRSLSQHFIKQAMTKLDEEKSTRTPSDPQAAKGRALRDISEFTKDPNELREQLLNLLSAGRDAVAALIIWSLMELGNNPQAWEKLRSEIIDKFGSFEGAGVGEGQAINFSSLKTCTYLQNVLQETLRLYPPVAFNFRKAFRDTVLPTGGGPNKDQPIAVPEGTDIGLNVWQMHRRTDLWGEDAAEWRPERWQGRKQDWSFLAFHGGPRHCPGEQLARTEAALTLCRMAQYFDCIESVDLPASIPKIWVLIMQPKETAMIRFHRA